MSQPDRRPRIVAQNIIDLDRANDIELTNTHDNVRFRFPIGTHGWSDIRISIRDGKLHVSGDGRLGLVLEAANCFTVEPR
jgi:hypothetical protein